MAIGFIRDDDVILSRPFNCSRMNESRESNAIQVDSDHHEAETEPIDVLKIVVNSIVLVSVLQMSSVLFRTVTPDPAALDCDKIDNCRQNEEEEGCDFDHYPESAALIDVFLQAACIDLSQGVLLILYNPCIEQNLGD